MKKNIILFISGQGISLFANQIFKFALYMYILEQTNSSVIYSKVMAVTMLPSILLSPVAGVICDRMDRKKIMVLLDLLSGIFIAVFFVFFQINQSIIAITIILFILSILGALENPAVQAAVPLISGDIAKINSRVAQVSSISAMFSPIMGGILYSVVSIEVITILTMLSYFIISFLETLLQLNKTEENAESSSLLRGLRDGAEYLVLRRKNILKLLIFAGGLSFFVTGLVVIGFPYWIRTELGMSAKIYGYSESLLGVAAIGGTFLFNYILKKIGVKRVYWMAIAIGINMSILGITMGFIEDKKTKFILIIIVFSIIEFVINIFSVSSLTIIMRNTDEAYMGRVMSYVSVLTLILQPISQLFYGFVVAKPEKNVCILIEFSAGLVVLMTMLSRNVFFKIGSSKEEEYVNKNSGM
ncbi:MAG: MFS transporter [Dorea sp.]|nr:MFS transporter [Dorea sp.]